MLGRDPALDAARMARIEAVSTAYDELRRRTAGNSCRRGRRSEDIGWQIEELQRVNLWAQQLGTPKPVSEKRIYRAIDSVEP